MLQAKLGRKLLYRCILLGSSTPILSLSRCNSSARHDRGEMRNKGSKNLIIQFVWSTCW